MRYTPEKITALAPEEVFVYGANLAGIHGAGAAKDALAFGAVMGVGEGMSGQTYAIPTKDWDIQTRSLFGIEDSVQKFLEFATKNPQLLFLVTPIGTGYAGYSAERYCAHVPRGS